ncbi:MAG: amylo-alpha-1,6-glucosidase [Anaerolineae bacterium]
MIDIPREVCRDASAAMTYEWLVTNGVGSYASSAITGARTRRYHGLLVGALEPPLGRTLLLAKLDEEVDVNGQTYRLGVNEYQRGVIEPSGNLFLQRAEVNGAFPVLYFQAANFKLAKTVWMEYGWDTTYIRYTLDPESPAINLTLLPFCSYRDFHETTKGDSLWTMGIEPVARGIRVTARPGARPFRILGLPSVAFTPLGLWYWHFQLRAEDERGLDHSEDLYLPGLLRARLEPGESLTVVATLEGDANLDVDAEGAWQRALGRQRDLESRAPDDFARQLYIAADQFLVGRPATQIPAPTPEDPAHTRPASTVLAGYHWFGDWGRDTMIALEGLTLTTGRYEVAHDILLTFSQFVSQGMLPNRFPDSGQAPEYNTVDATLWYFHAIDRYVTCSHDRDLLRQLYPILQDMINWHVKGTRYNIHMDLADGLVYAGEPGVQLTWMDAKVEDRVVTPRTGKPVEINALWYNALRLMQQWSKELDQPDPLYERLANQVAGSFDRFWFREGGYLYDVIDGPNGNETAMRPNQIFAMSLPHSAVPLPQARSALELITRELLTPYGLRSLTPRNVNYRGKFTGGRAARDSAYHNGTVWAWLIGPYIDAHRRVYPDDPDRGRFLAAFQPHLSVAGLGTISECFEGDAPHRPVACIAQAWSVAEVLRAYCAISGEGH